MTGEAQGEGKHVDGQQEEEVVRESVLAYAETRNLVIDDLVEVRLS